MWYLTRRTRDDAVIRDARMGWVMKKSLTLLLALAVASAASVANAGVIAQTTLSGTDDIFAAGLTSITNDTDNGGQGVLPYSLPVTGLEQLYVTTSGKVWCCDANNAPPSTAAGFATNPFAGYSGSTITNIVAGSTVPSYAAPSTGGGIFELLYTFTNAGGTDIGGLNTLPQGGTSGNITVPVGATEIYFGFADGYGFNGDSGAYGDNNNNADAGAPGILLTISSAPEPAAWVLMLLGVGSMGTLLRLGHRARKPSGALV
jgi:hypothetical protein